MQKSSFSVDHPALAVTYMDVGCVLAGMKEYRQGARFSEIARDKFSRHFPSHHPQSLLVFEKFGDCSRRIVKVLDISY